MGLARVNVGEWEESFGCTKVAEEHKAEEVFVIFPLRTPKSHWRQSLQWYGAMLGLHYWTGLCYVHAHLHLAGQRGTTKGGFAEHKHRTDHKLGSACLTEVLKSLTAKAPAIPHSHWLQLHCAWPLYPWLSFTLPDNGRQQKAAEMWKNLAVLSLEGSFGHQAKFKKMAGMECLQIPVWAERLRRVATGEENNEQLSTIPLPSPARHPLQEPLSPFLNLSHVGFLLRAGTFLQQQRSPVEGTYCVSNNSLKYLGFGFLTVSVRWVRLAAGAMAGRNAKQPWL